MAQRRIPALLAAGARVEVVAPETTPAVEGYARAGDLLWHPRAYAPGDLAGAWYVVCACDDPDVNEAVTSEAEDARVFCVRSDDADAATAWTPAVGRYGPLTVAVLGSRDPRRSAAVRDEILVRLRTGEIAAPKDRVRRAGVTLVGGGPGDPELITVAGRRALQEADVVVADRLAPRELLSELRPEVELVDAAKLPRGRYAAQESINAVLVNRARRGLAVVRLKGGDPYVFGRGFEEAQACVAAGVPVRVVPGITSAVAAPALGGVPVTHRGVAHEFTVVSGHLPPGHPDSHVDWGALGAGRATIVLMMAVENLRQIRDALLAGGRAGSTAVAVVQDGSLDSQVTTFTTLAELVTDLDRYGVRPPATIVVGEVVAVARRLADDVRAGAASRSA